MKLDKLTLNRETLRALEDQESGLVQAGAGTNVSGCLYSLCCGTGPRTGSACWCI